MEVRNSGSHLSEASADLVRRIAKTIDRREHTHPHAVYAAFTHGMVGKWTYVARTTPNIGRLLQPLEDIIKTKLLPALSGKPASERDLLALSARLGTIGVTNPTTLSDPAYSASKQISAPSY